jgi:hypothetical protein
MTKETFDPAGSVGSSLGASCFGGTHAQRRRDVVNPAHYLWANTPEGRRLNVDY